MKDTIYLPSFNFYNTSHPVTLLVMQPKLEIRLNLFIVRSEIIVQPI